MTREPNDIAAREARVREVLRASNAPAPDPAFRERLRQAFVSGEIESRAAAAEAPARPGVHARAGGRREGARVRAPARPGIFGVRWWLWAPVAAAAAVIVLTFAGRGPSWEVRAVEGQGSITVRGRAVAAGDASAWAGALDRGAKLAVPEGMTVDLVQGGIVAVRVMPGTDVTLPRRTNRWFARELTAQVRGGELLVRTGPDFPGREMIVETPEGRTEITGTMVSIVRGDGFTCVCVLEGVAHVGYGAGDMDPVPAGRRKVLFADRRPALLDAIEPHHEAGLREYGEEEADPFGR